MVEILTDGRFGELSLFILVVFSLSFSFLLIPSIHQSSRCVLPFVSTRSGESSFSTSPSLSLFSPISISSSFSLVDSTSTLSFSQPVLLRNPPFSSPSRLDSFPESVSLRFSRFHPDIRMYVCMYPLLFPRQGTSMQPCVRNGGNRGDNYRRLCSSNLIYDRDDPRRGS